MPSRRLPPPADGPLPGGRPPRHIAEAASADIRRLLQDKSFDSIEDVNAFIAQYLAGGDAARDAAAEAAPLTPMDRAQDLVYEAWDTTSRTRRVTLARQAIELWPDCADAYLLMAEEAKTPGEALALLGQAVAAGERALGDEMQGLVSDGSMWLAIEARPYMRARSALAELCWATGDRQAAIAHGWELLRLNPNDNQGVRYEQVVRLLHAGSIADLDRLFAEYPEDASAMWLYGRALHAFRVHGPGTTATAALRAARRTNAHVPEYFLGRRAFPAELPDYVGWGDESEAVACADALFSLWVEAPGSLDWLDAGAPRAGGRKKKKR